MTEHQIATPRQRNWVPCGCLLAMFLICILVPVGAYMSWSYRAASQVQTQLARIRHAGLPTDYVELDQHYQIAAGAADATSLYMAAQREFSGSPYEADCQNLPIVGDADDVPPPGQPWAEQQAVEALLARYDDGLKTLHQAAAMGGAARFPLAWEDGFSMLLPHTQSMRACSRMLALEANVRAHRGDAQGTAESLLAMATISRSLENQPILVSQLVRVAMHGMTVNLTTRLLPHVDFSDEDLRRLQQAFRRDDFKVGIAHALSGERVLGSEAFADPAQALGPDRGLPAGLIRGSNEDLALYLEIQTDLHDAVSLPYPEPFVPVQAAFDKIIDRIGTPLGRMRYPMTALTLPAVEASVLAAARTDALNRCLDAAIAVEQFRRREGKLPETLGELVPDFLPEAPMDPFDGQPLRYLVKADGYVVYSCGRDQTDDGGVEDDQQTDVVIRIDLKTARPAADEAVPETAAPNDAVPDDAGPKGAATLEAATQEAAAAEPPSDASPK